MSTIKNRQIDGFAPNLGLEAIDRLAVDHLNGSDPNLPAQRESPLTGGPVRHWVGELFRPGTLDQQLRQFARTALNDPALLAPARFEALVRDSAAVLNDLAARDHDPALAAASALLSEEVQLRDLLATYRSVLMRA